MGCFLSLTFRMTFGNGQSIEIVVIVCYTFFNCSFLETGGYRMIRCIIFDVGDVILQYHRFLVVCRLARFSGKPDAEVRAFIFGAEDHPETSVAHLLDSGMISDDELLAILRYQWDIHQEVSDCALLESFWYCCEFDDRMRTLLYFLHQRYALGIISNNNALQWRYIESACPILHRRSGIFRFHTLSFELGFLKPDPRIFEAAFCAAYDVVWRSKKIQLAPHDCLFFDDLESNVNAAEDFGMRVWHVDAVPSYESILRGLRRHGVELPTEKDRIPPDVDFHRIIYPYEKIRVS